MQNRVFSSTKVSVLADQFHVGPLPVQVWRCTSLRQQTDHFNNFFCTCNRDHKKPTDGCGRLGVWSHKQAPIPLGTTKKTLINELYLHRTAYLKGGDWTTTGSVNCVLWLCFQIACQPHQTQAPDDRRANKDNCWRFHCHGRQVLQANRYWHMLWGRGISYLLSKTNKPTKKRIQETGSSLGNQALRKWFCKTATVTCPCALTTDLPAGQNLYLDCTGYSHWTISCGKVVWR